MFWQFGISQVVPRQVCLQIFALVTLLVEIKAEPLGLVATLGGIVLIFVSQY